MIFYKSFTIKTKGFEDVINITDKINFFVKESNITEGIIVISLAGSTGSITTIEYESGLVNDIKSVLNNLIPRGVDYNHNLKWGDGNGDAHIKSALLGTSKSFSIHNGKIILGTWQQIVFIDFDNRSRNRDIHIQIIGE